MGAAKGPGSAYYIAQGLSQGSITGQQAAEQLNQGKITSVSTDIGKFLHSQGVTISPSSGWGYAKPAGVTGPVDPAAPPPVKPNAVAATDPVGAAAGTLFFGRTRRGRGGRDERIGSVGTSASIYSGSKTLTGT